MSTVFSHLIMLSHAFPGPFLLYDLCKTIMEAGAVHIPSPINGYLLINQPVRIILPRERLTHVHSLIGRPFPFPSYNESHRDFKRVRYLIHIFLSIYDWLHLPGLQLCSWCDCGWAWPSGERLNYKLKIIIEVETKDPLKGRTVALLQDVQVI